MFDFLQITTKITIIGVIAIVAIIGALRVWRADLDLRQLVSPSRAVEKSVKSSLDWLPTRESSALYQDLKLAARVSGARVDEATNLVEFEEIYQSSDLDLNREFEFQKWRLRFKGADMIVGLDSSAPQKGQIVSKAVCTIIGTRSAL